MQFWSASIEKQVGDRVQTVLKDPYLMRAYVQFGADILRRSSVFHGLNQFLLEQKVKGRRCFEIGTWNGLTSAILSRYFDEVVSVDIEHRLIKHEVLEYLGIRNVECYDIADNAGKAQVWKKFKGEFDFCYMDGDHENDTETDFNLVRSCKRVLFHEAWPFQEPVWMLVHQLPRDEVTMNGLGLALWEGR